MRPCKFRKTDMTDSEIRADAGASATIDQAALVQLGPGQPGLAVAVVKDGQIAHLVGYGLANLRTRAPVTPRTMFHLASCGKQFTGLGVMMLQEAVADFGYDDHLGAHVPELAGFPQGVTIRRLLHHLSAIRDLYDAEGTAQLLRQSARPTNDDVVHAYVAMNFPMNPSDPVPGRSYDYSNSGYDMLGTVIERVTEESYADFFRNNVFGPLGMDDSFSFPEARLDNPRRAVGHNYHSGNFIVEPGDPLDLITGSGSFFSSVADLCIYDKALTANQLVSEASLKAAMTSGVTQNGVSIDYGFGWGVATIGSRAYAEHTGWWAGYISQFRRAIDGRLGVYVLSNNTALELGIVVDAATAVYG
jgi:CubicO group peptidase (beta-lactamase class C family)